MWNDETASILIWHKYEVYVIDKKKQITEANEEREKGMVYIACLKMRPERVGFNMFK